MKSLLAYFKCGRYDVPGGKNWGHFLCKIFSDNYNITLPFVSQYLIRGSKAQDFSDWVKVAKRINQKGHLT